MEWTSKDVIGVISYMLPGFLAAWVFYSLTAHPRKSPFERVVQALIFTVIVSGMTTVTRWVLESVDPKYSFGVWNPEIGQVWSIINATFLGVVFALFANRDWAHSALRKLGLTSRTSFPSEWFSAFNRDRRHIILHLEGGRRLYGWPFEWPDQGDCGHFVMVDASWILDNNETAPLLLVERLVVPVKHVELVEILKTDIEITATAPEIESVERRLVELQESGETEDGKQSTTTATPSNRQSNEQPLDGHPARTTTANVPAPASQKRKMRNRNHGR